MVAGALRVLAGPEAEVEANCNQVNDVVGFGFTGAGCRGDNIVNDSQGGGIFSSDGGILEPVGLEFPREALVEPGVRL